MQCKDYYWAKILQNRGHENINIDKWITKYDISTDLYNIFYLPFKNTMETRMQTFQYSILNRYVPHSPQ